MQVQKLRLQRGWSQQQLAELSGLSTRTIQRIENGQAASTESLKALASVFEIDFSILSREPVMQAPSSPNDHEVALALSKVRKIKGFYIHLGWYVLVVLLLGVINGIATPHKLWFFWPALGWGLGIMAHSASVFRWIPFLGPAWERKQVEKHLGRPL